MNPDTIFMGFLVLAAILDYLIQKDKDAREESDRRVMRNFGRKE